MASEDRRKLSISYLKRFIGIAYRWGGDDPLAGFDCSGLIVEILQSVGIIPHGSDYSAQGLRERFAGTPCEPKAGALIFWLRNDRAYHIEMLISAGYCIGASGGNENTDSEEDASAMNAFVKMRPIGYRGKNFIMLDPFA
jgi:cell wall-associated NlpC family hydrolase